MREHPDLELKEHSSLSETAWTIQRIGWVVMLLFVIAAILGLFGAGPLDQARIHRDGIEVSYSRFQRMTSDADLKVTVSRALADRTDVSMERHYVQQFEISGVTPQPESVTSSSDQLRYAFCSEAGQPFTVTFRLRANEGTFGPVTGRVRVAGIGQAEFVQFIWP